MPDRLRAAFSPARLGDYLSGADFCSVECFFYHLFFGSRTGRSGRSPPRCGKAGKTPGGDRVCLDFLVLFHQGKRTYCKQPQVCLKHQLMFCNGSPPCFTFFLLEQKEPKIQECRIASGRHSAHRAWAAIFLSLIFLVLIFAAFNASFTMCFF